MIIQLQQAKNIHRDENGNIFAWQAYTIKEFTDIDRAIKYAKRYGKKYRNLRFFTGSASLMNALNNYLDEEIR